MEDELLVLDRSECTPASAGAALATDDFPSTDVCEVPLMETAPAYWPSADPPGPALAPTGPRVAERDEPNAEQILEALLFAADTPLSLTRLTELVGDGSSMQIRLHLAALNDKYTAAGLSFRIESIARGYQMMTLPRYQPWLARLNQQRSQTRLSPAALETLSVVAYKQPVIRADIEAIRGVACGEVLGRLRELGLVRIVGRAEVIGRPLMYGTTKKFLDSFGLADLDDLPPIEALTLRRRSEVPAEPAAPAVTEPTLAVGT